MGDIDSLESRSAEVVAAMAAASARFRQNLEPMTRSGPMSDVRGSTMTINNISTRDIGRVIDALWAAGATVEINVWWAQEEDEIEKRERS